jgi:hypothetical protein
MEAPWRGIGVSDSRVLYRKKCECLLALNGRVGRLRVQDKTIPDRAVISYLETQ